MTKVSSSFFMPDEDLDIELVSKVPRKLDIGIVGYGPSGIIAAIALSKQGHHVTIFEKDFYDWNQREITDSDKAYMYPIFLG